MLAIGYGQAFGLVGAGLLAGIGLFVWFADRMSRRYGEVDSLSSCLTSAVVITASLGCLILLVLALLG